MVEAGVLQTAVDVLLYVVGREGVVERELARARPAAILRRDFRGRVKFPVRVRADEPAEQGLAPPLAVGPRRVEEVAAEFDRALKRLQRFFVVRAAPAPHAPHAVADLADLPPRAPESPVPHSGFPRLKRVEVSSPKTTGSSLYRVASSTEATARHN